jgi:two-component sensor histidine kinase
MSYLSDPDRLAALEATELLDSDPEPAFDRITKLASRLLGAPVALVSLVDDKRQFFKSQVGLAAPRETPLSHSFCQHVVVSKNMLAVTDAENDPRVRDNLAVRDLKVAAYLGVPLATPDGHVLGSLCAIDGSRRTWSEEDISALRDLASIVMDEIALRTEVKLRRGAEAHQKLLIAELHHRVKNTLATVQAVIHLSIRAATDLDAFGGSIGPRIASLANTHTLLNSQNWGGISFRELIGAELAPYSGGGRVTFDGPDFEMASQEAVTLGMVIHELTTNAVKYGALSVDAGRLAIAWTLAPSRKGNALDLRWSERGGAEVTAPIAEGFGTTLLRRLLTGQLHGSVEFTAQPGGLAVHATARLATAKKGK